MTCFAVMIPAMHVIHKLAHIVEEIGILTQPPSKTGPIGGMQILDHVSSTKADLLEHDFKGLAHMWHHVAAIIEHDIHAAHLGYDRFEKGRIVLRADPDLSVNAVIRAAVFVDIYSENNGLWPEIAAPHRERAAF